MILRDEVQIGVTDFWANKERSEVVDFSPILAVSEYYSSFKSVLRTTIFSCSRVKFFVKYPGRDLGGLFLFLKGFRADTWIGFLLLLLVLPISLYLVYSALKLFGLHEPFHWNLLHNFLIYLGAIGQQVTNSE